MIKPNKQQRFQMVKFPSIQSIKDNITAGLPKLPTTGKAILFAGAGVVIGHEIYNRAMVCASEGSKLAMQTLKDKSLESLNKDLIAFTFSLSVCQPQYLKIAAYALGVTACIIVAKREVFTKPLPTPPAK
jgi:hypothetical protein